MLFEVAEVIELGTAIPVLDDGDICVDWPWPCEVAEVTELISVIQVHDEGDTPVD